MKLLASTISLIACLLGTAVAAPTPPARLVLVRDGKPASTVIIARDATRAAQFAAYELQWHVRQITGAELPIVRDDQEVSGTRILIGESAATAALGLKSATFKPQEYLVRFVPGQTAGVKGRVPPPALQHSNTPTLLLIGRDKDDRTEVVYDHAPDQAALSTWPTIWDERGSLHAVYDFLERSCGVRWLNQTETGTVLPQTKTLAVTGGERRRAPFFRYRWASYASSEGYDVFTSLWPSSSDGYYLWEAAAYPELRRRFPDANRYRVAKRGWVELFRLRMREGGEKCVGNHSLYGYYKRFWEKDPGSPNAFVEKHADWFAQGYEGTPPQMCYTNPGLVAQVAQDARDYFDGKGINPHSLTPIKDRNDVWGENYFCVEPMDNSQFCRCARCREWLPAGHDFDPFFSNGVHSNYFFQFVNAVAKELRKTHPQRTIVTLAYMTHAAPPTQVKLERNVLVQYCFACNRLNFDRASYEHEVALLKEWSKQARERPLYLWLYYTFPVEVANGGKFHCFPGFFAHAVGEQFRLFRDHGFRGVFHCGYGQEVEAYVTYKLMDDPSRDVDALLEEYFRGVYGAAAEPMKRLYLAIERTYSDPANYPEAIASGRKEGHHHQTEEVAWGYLGTEARMAQFAKLLEQAKAAARTEAEQRNVALFEKGVWDYMVAGRRLYEEHTKAKYGGIAAPVRVPFTDRPLEGDPVKLVRDDSAVLWGWRSRMGERTRRDVEARLLHDGQFLYVQLEEKVDLKALRASADVAAGDHWDLLLAAKREGPCYQVVVGPGGATICRELGREGSPGIVWDNGANVVSDVAKPGRWRVSLAIPLGKLPGGGRPGASLFLNVARCSPGSDDEPVCTPTFGDWHDVTRLREVILDTPEMVPAQVPTDAELRELAVKDLVGLWKLGEGGGTTVRDSSGNGLNGTLANGAGWANEGARSVLSLEDRRGQYVDLGNPDAANLDGPLTLEAWVKYEKSESWYPAVVGKGYERTGAYSLHLRPGLTPWFELDEANGTRHFYNPTDLPLTPGAWCHVAATYDGATMRVYVNGRLAGPGKEAKLSVRKTSEPLRIGWLGSYGYLNGRVRDVALYRRAMSAGEVYARYRAAK